MSSPLLIAYPDIPYNAMDVVTAEEYSDFRPVYNLFRGYRSHHGQLVADTNSTRTIDFNLATAQTASYMIIARADLLEDQGITLVTLQRSSDNSSWTTVTSSSLDENLRSGPKSQDLLLTFTETSAYRYWRVYFDSTLTSKLRFSKIYLGNMFDFGVAPDRFSYDIGESDYNEFEADSGSIHVEQFREPRRVLTVTWDGVSDATLETLIGPNGVIQSFKEGLFFYTASQPQILNYDTLLHAELISINKDDQFGYPDWNTLTMTFREMLG